MADIAKKFFPIIIVPSVVFALAASIALISLGITNISTEDQIIEHKKVTDYTYCTSGETNASVTCFNVVNAVNRTCTCKFYVNLLEPFHGRISFHYETSFDQSGSDYVKSRDDAQLMGILSPTPSSDCEPYRFDKDNKPIAPCGAIADSLFQDVYKSLYMCKNIDPKKYVCHNNRNESMCTIDPNHYMCNIDPNEYMCNIDTGEDICKDNSSISFTGFFTAEEKIGYKNPPYTERKKFSSPVSWGSKFLNLSFENDRFVGWMKTDLKRKPIGLLNQSSDSFIHGLEKGLYYVEMTYSYQKNFNGSRKLIFLSDNVTLNNGSQTAGVIQLSIGCCFLAMAALGIFFLYYLTKRSENDTAPKVPVPLIDEASNKPELRPLNGDS